MINLRKLNHSPRKKGTAFLLGMRCANFGAGTGALYVKTILELKGGAGLRLGVFKNQACVQSGKYSHLVFFAGTFGDNRRQARNHREVLFESQ